MINSKYFFMIDSLFEIENFDLQAMNVIILLYYINTPLGVKYRRPSLGSKAYAKIQLAPQELNQFTQGL